MPDTTRHGFETRRIPVPLMQVRKFFVLLQELNVVFSNILGSLIMRCCWKKKLSLIDLMDVSYKH